MSGSPAVPTEIEIGTKLRDAVALHIRGELPAALRLYEEILSAQPRHFDALHLSGVVVALSGHPGKAVELIDKAIAVDPANAAAYNNRGRALYELGRWEAALADYDRAASLNRGYPDPHYNCGNLLKDRRQWDAALRSYDRCLALQADNADALCNRGVVLMELKLHAAAVASFDRAVTIRPTFGEAHYNRGNALCGIGDWQAAIASYDRAIEVKADFADAHGNRGFALNQLHQFTAAIADWDRALALKPSLSHLRGEICFTRMRLCDWSQLDSDRRRLSGEIERGETVCAPFTVLAWSECAALQKTIAASWVRKRWPPDSALGQIPKRAPCGTIRLGYFSADFHEHATSHLIAGLLERHHRPRFQVIAFSFGPHTHDPMRQRIVAACDRFIDVRLQGDADVAMLARHWEIDIAIDLKGFTQDHRLGIFALRAAPIQVAYLGYPGTSGASYMDYIIADRVVIPATSRCHIVEKIAYLPGSYQVNDARRRIAERVFTRPEFGLPQKGFVFCCFNNNFKITPETFATWMKILRRVEGSVLWLLADNGAVVGNLRSEAMRRGVDCRRLVFAQRIALPEHLARHRLADLFLDTLPYNAHTTASDALWTGLPVLTCAGEAFASRVAASLLTSVGLPELIVSNLQEYEEKAVRLAADPEYLAHLKTLLQNRRLGAPLFDIQSYVEHIEAAYIEMYQRHQQDLPPAHMAFDLPGKDGHHERPLASVR